MYEDPVGGGKDCPATWTALRGRHLMGYFIRRQEIVGVKPLNELSTAQPESLIPSRGSTLVLLGDDANGVRFKLSCDDQSTVGGAVVHDDNLFGPPSLRERRTQRIRNPRLRVVCGYKNGHQRP